MKNQLSVTFNNQDYIATYNSQSGYYELELKTPDVGGIYTAYINFTDLFEQEYEDSLTVQVFAKEAIKIETNKVFMWIFDYKDFSVKDIVEISSYDLTIDDELNANSFIKVLKKTTAKSRDIVAIKKNNVVVYWGIVDNIQNTDGQNLYEYTLKYITNLFNQDIILNSYENRNLLDNNEIINIKPVVILQKYASIVNNNVEVGEVNTNWKIEKKDDYYIIKDSATNKVLTAESLSSEANVVVADYQNFQTQHWQIEQITKTKYEIKLNNFCLTVENGETENGTNIKIHEDLGNETKQQFVLEIVESMVIKDVGIEDFIAKKITDNFISNEDTFVNLNYLQLNIKTHNKKSVSVTNVENNIFNLHTYMTNCTQLYDVTYSFSIINKKFVTTIETKQAKKELIDVNAQPVSEYDEVFEIDVVSKVIVLTSTDTYTLYLLNDRTTTTDMTNVNRAEGKTVTVYTENYEEARQVALDQMKANAYNHKITFKYLNRFIRIGTPIAIKTKKSLIYDTYISAIKITQNKFIEYTCGNIRTGFIDKLLKERNS